MAADPWAGEWPIPPPMRIVRKGWWVLHELTKFEAEAYHLREAAKLCGCFMQRDRARQEHHLEEARRNRWWGAVIVPTPRRQRPKDSTDAG
jgi:hypothetical protein